MTEAEPGHEPIWLRRENCNGRFAVERASDQQRIGEIRWGKSRPLPKPAPYKIEFDMKIDLAETFEVPLL